mgnify:CR=1 FL=1
MDLLNRSEKIFKVCAYLLVIAFAAVTLYDRVCVQRLHQRPGGLREREHRAPAQGCDPAGLRHGAPQQGFLDCLCKHPVLYGGWHGVEYVYLSDRCLRPAKEKAQVPPSMELLLVFTMWFSAGMIPLYLNYKSMNVDNRWGMIIAFGVQAYNIILLRNYFDSIPKEIEEAAWWTALPNSSCSPGSMCPCPRPVLQR